MSVYVIGDLHLSLSVNKSMDIFAGWENYVQRLKNNWEQNVKNDDTVILAGDISWGMKLEEALADFQFIENLPGKKILLKGNHDYWWTSASKMKSFFEDNNLTSLDIMHNNSFFVEDKILGGSRGWLFENGAPHDDKIINREALRIEASLKHAVNQGYSGEKILFLHYPPIYGEQIHMQFFDIMRKYGITSCYYGHIHGAGHKQAFQGSLYGIRIKMISADYINFTPCKV